MELACCEAVCCTILGFASSNRSALSRVVWILANEYLQARDFSETSNFTTFVRFDVLAQIKKQLCVKERKRSSSRKRGDNSRYFGGTRSCNCWMYFRGLGGRTNIIPYFYAEVERIFFNARLPFLVHRILWAFSLGDSKSWNQTRLMPSTHPAVLSYPRVMSISIRIH